MCGKESIYIFMYIPVDTGVMSISLIFWHFFNFRSNRKWHPNLFLSIMLELRNTRNKVNCLIFPSWTWTRTVLKNVYWISGFSFICSPFIILIILNSILYFLVIYKQYYNIVIVSQLIWIIAKDVQQRIKKIIFSTILLSLFSQMLLFC